MRPARPHTRPAAVLAALGSALLLTLATPAPAPPAPTTAPADGAARPAAQPAAPPHTRPAAVLAALGSALLLALATAAAAPAAPTTARADGAARPAARPVAPLAAGTPVAANGQLEVCGTRLCNEHGHPVQLRGMSSHGTQWYAQCLTGGSLDALAEDWKADVLRVSTYVQEGGYETDPRRFTELASSLIEQATERGMYVIVDWHMLDPGDPMVNLDNARAFFTDIARRHQGKNNVLYEIANEPSRVSWSRIKDY